MYESDKIKLKEEIENNIFQLDQKIEKLSEVKRLNNEILKAIDGDYDNEIQRSLVIGSIAVQISIVAAKPTLKTPYKTGGVTVVGEHFDEEIILTSKGQKIQVPK